MQILRPGGTYRVSIHAARSRDPPAVEFLLRPWCCPFHLSDLIGPDRLMEAPTATSSQQLCSGAGGSFLIPWVPPFQFKEDASQQMATGRLSGPKLAGYGSGQGSSSPRELWSK